MYIYKYLASLFRKKSEAPIKDFHNFKLEENWSIFAQTDKLILYSQFAGEIRFGPVYLKLKSEPSITKLSDKIFGEWFGFYKNGILLQEWNSLKDPNTNLLFVSSDSENIEILAQNIPSIFWNFENENGNAKVVCSIVKSNTEYVNHEVNLH